MDFALVALVLLAIGLRESALGPRTPVLVSLLALLAVAPIALRILRDRERFARLPWLVLGLLFLAPWFAGRGAAAGFALAASLSFFSIAGGSSLARSGPTMALTAFAHAAFVAVRDHMTLWTPLSALSERWTSMVAAPLEATMRLGPTFSGLWIVIVFLLAFAASAVASRRIAWRSAAPAFLLTVAMAAAVPALRWIALTQGFQHRASSVLGWRASLFVLLLVPLAIWLRAHRPEEGAAPLRRPRLRLAGAAALVLLGLALLCGERGVAGRPVRVLLDARGAFSLQPLAWGQYGPMAPQGASLATLPGILEARGYTLTVWDTTLDADALARHDVLVVMNPTAAPSREEQDAVWEFVMRGGGLLVLGDHTNIQGVMEPANALLGPCGIELAFDSAIPLVDRWTWYGCIRALPHPVTRGLRDEGDLKVSVGASLEIPWRAMPILIGRDAFSDAGDWSNAGGAYLGNMHADVDERLGDLCLAAECSYGRGKVIVFGDTSPFQRTAVFTSNEFVCRVLTYLGTPGSSRPPLAVRAAGAVFLSAGAVLLAVSLPAAMPVIALVSAVAAIGLAAVERSAGIRVPDAEHGRLAWIDLAHGNRVDLHSGRADGISGLVDHFWRQGRVPLAMKRFDEAALNRAEVFVTVAPARPFGKGERRALRGFVERGGLLVVASGFEERRGTEGLLAEFGYSLGRTPIGAAHEAKAFGGGGVIMAEAWPIEGRQGIADVWVECWGYPLVVFERVGRGLVVIGDSRFLCDSKLESNESYVEQNIDFLRAAFDAARERSGGGSP